jgi:polar amino acid transport system substrate-binding protein
MFDGGIEMEHQGVRAAVTAATLGLCMVAGGCGSGSEATSSGPRRAVQPPQAVQDADELVFCSDMTFPPFEFQEAGKPKGVDIELGQAVARLMGVKATFAQTGFSGIIAAIQTRKCDAMVNGVYETPERKKQLSFTSYAQVGQAVLVRKDNPAGLTGVDALSGKSVAVQVGTANRDYLKDVLNVQLRKAGRAPTQVVAFPQNTDAINALRTNRVDAYFSGTPEIAYLAKQEPGSFRTVGDQVAAQKIGIAVRREDADLQRSMQDAVRRLYATGVVPRILARWGLRDAALPG